MMSPRLSPLGLFCGHWKSLTDVRDHRGSGDWVTRSVLLLAILCWPAGWLWDWSIRAPQPILAGVSLMAGALVGSFGQVNTLRLKLTDREGDDDAATQIDRDALDESAAHLLTSALLCAVTAVLLVLGINLSTDTGSNPAVTGIWAAPAIASGAYAVATFFIAVPRLYGAYVAVNNVSGRVNGYVRGR